MIVSACADQAADQNSVQIAEREAAEAVFRFMFDANGSMLKRAATSYCIGFGEMNLADPDNGFIQEFDDITPKVKVASQCGFDDYIVTDRDSGKASLIFRLSNGKCDTIDHCRFRGGYLEANLSVSSEGYLADRVNGIWSVRVDLDSPGWIS